MSVEDFQTRPQFPSINKYVRILRKIHRDYMSKVDRARFPSLAYWHILVPDAPVAPIPIDPLRAPTADIIDGTDYPLHQAPLTKRLELVDYPQPPENAIEELPVSNVDRYGEAEWDKKAFKGFLIPAYVKVTHTAVLTKFGRVQKSEGEIKISRFILEDAGLEPSPGDLFMWAGKLRVVIDAFEEYGYIGTSDYWTWLKLPYSDFHGDSSNLELPDVPTVDLLELPDEQ